jgi:hypothetical protein
MYNCHTGNGKYKPLLCGYLRGGSDTEIERERRENVSERKRI